MCGRYANYIRDLGDWEKILGDWPDDIALGYNIAPTQTVPVFIDHKDQHKGIGMRWGLVPSWSKQPAAKFATFNARSETVAEKPAFRTAWEKAQTCLIPALGYYEWKGEKGDKQPYFIRAKNSEPLVMAGLWDCWRGDELELYSCTIITQPAVGQLTEVHDRMPVTLELKQAEVWLKDGINRFNLIVKQQHTERLDVYPVSKTVNRATSDGEELIARDDATSL
ncbi:SOS response-associated peptidase [Candidatus Spongiihabitans sp.]|uniref:SOS response-associated peptidase n=1 Tax=Candidatus Spongiihabitans sp. TaxID=3101308 RepID=UPI003C7A62EF